MATIFSEDTRVKIPALVHMTRLGYSYISRDEVAAQADPATNILKNIFFESIKRLNPEITDDATIERLLQDIILELDYDDLGRKFFERLQNGEIKLIDFENFNNNTFSVSTEVTCKNGEDEFRPDVVFFVNGIPLGFIEVKKPNNRDGIKAERDRMKKRIQNRKFRRFFNEFQFYLFSNNMEYEEDDKNHLMGAYYATGGKTNLRYNHFYEQKKSEVIEEIGEIDEGVEDLILKDNNLTVIKTSSEYKTNKNPESPTNRIITGLLSKPRLEYLLRYGIAYVNEVDDKTGFSETQKHIMRYPQLFASKAIEATLEKGAKRGIIWHTQGSGKTALAYFNVKTLTDYYAKKGVIPKFYFIVDRIDLAVQAASEFGKRGLKVRTVNSRDELNQEFANNTATVSGEDEICVVNIQKFKDDTTALDNSGYDIQVQRIYFLDEAHRSYNPTGSFLANLYNSDKDSVKIALTGTPLIVQGERGEKLSHHTTRDIFGDYIHKYYYNESIRDGYTLKLLREEIETTYVEKIDGIYKDLQVRLGKEIDKRLILAHPQYVSGMLDYIVKDFKLSRIQYGDDTIGAMIVCDSAIEGEGKPNQAREIYNQLAKNYGELSAALITNEEGDKETRKQQIRDFKEGKIDILIVYNMLLTGFDCPRLKKLYLGRVVKAHNLLQALTRVNRPYKNFRMGYVVDFANISEEFDKTNQAYLNELKGEYGDGLDENPDEVFGSIFMSRKEIEDEIRRVKEAVFDYTLDNLETFSSQVSQIQDREPLNDLRRALESARDLSNLIRLFGHQDLLNELDFKQLGKALIIVNDRISLLNVQKALENSADMQGLVNIAIEDVIFNFEKIREEELRLAAEDCQALIKRTRTAFSNNWDPDDPEYLSLYDAFLEIMRKQSIESMDMLELKASEQGEINRSLEEILKKIEELNRRNRLIMDKFHGNQKAARVYKKLSTYDGGKIGTPEARYAIILQATNSLDEQLLHNSGILSSEGYFRGQVQKCIMDAFDSTSTDICLDALNYATEQLYDEYIKDYEGDE